MKLFNLPSLAAAASLAFIGSANAYDHHDHHDSHHDDHHDDHHDSDHHDHHDRDWWNRYHRHDSVVFINGGYSYNPYFYDEPVYYSRPVYQATVVGANVVVDVQRRLRHEGYYYGAVDGVIGPGTRGAIASYQRDHGLAPTGRINGALLDSLDLT